MKTKRELFPKVSITTKGHYFVYFWYCNKRYRYANSSCLGLSVYPNLLSHKDRAQEAENLRLEFFRAISDGWRPVDAVIRSIPISALALDCLKKKLQLDFSDSYKRDLKFTSKSWNNYLLDKGIGDKPVTDLTLKLISDFIYEYAPSPASMANLKRNISALLKDELESNGAVLNFSRIKLPKTPQHLHKPLPDIGALLSDIKTFNSNLYLCCLMTYTMLLRPHREVRCLSFGDFNSHFTQVSLSGAKVKSKRNRVLPVPEVVRAEVLQRFTGNRKDNVFSLTEEPYNRDYFKTLWSRYKRQSSLLERDQTLYSFRHTGAIKVFEKTGSLLKLQQVMGHSDMKVSLTYLRGLEVAQISEQDLPVIF